MSIALGSPTLARTLANVRNLLNQPNAANSFWSDPELIDYINEGCRMYFAEVVGEGEGEFTKSSDLDIVANSETISLPSDCYQVRAVFKKVSNGFAIIPYRNNLTDSYSTQGGDSSDSYSGYYYFRDNSLVLRPVPTFSETAGIRLEYIYFPDTLINGGDTFNANISPVFKQLIETYAVYKAKVKESLVNNMDTTSAAAASLNLIYGLFKQSIGERTAYPVYTVPFNPEG